MVGTFMKSRQQKVRQEAQNIPWTLWVPEVSEGTEGDYTTYPCFNLSQKEIKDLKDIINRNKLIFKGF